MPFVAIIGAGPLGGALAHKLAGRGRVAEVRLIDSQGSVAQGKALDILQSSPVEGFATKVTSAESIDAAVGANAIVLADRAAGDGEHAGDAGLALLRRLHAAGASCPVVCAGSSPRDLIAKAVGELRLDRAKFVGSAPFALESALRALAAVAIDGSAVEIDLRVVGVPPRSAVIAWEAATAFGQPLSSELPAHVRSALAARIPGLWPLGPYALASAAARVTEAIVCGSRKRFSCFVALDAGAHRNAVAAMPVELGPTGVDRIAVPALTRQEQTLLENAIERG
jgi:malate dehydrogenase